MIQPRDEAEFQSALAQLAIAAKRFDQAEAALRKAAQAAPRNAAKLEELAVFLSRRGKHEESDQVFRRARELQPGRPAWLFARAQALTETRRLPGEARTLLEAYLAAPRTPDDPSAGEARRLLDQLPSSARKSTMKWTLNPLRSGDALRAGTHPDAQAGRGPCRPPQSGSGDGATR